MDSRYGGRGREGQMGFEGLEKDREDDKNSINHDDT